MGAEKQGQPAASCQSWWNLPYVYLDNGGKKVEKAGKRAKDRGRKRKEIRAGFVYLFIKGILLFGHARNVLVEGEAPKEAWQTASR